MMLRSITRPAICYDLIGLAADGLITVGRESESHIRLDSPEVPFLLSRKHATLQFQPDGNIIMKDLDSTNGTYTARGGQPLRRMGRGAAWELKPGDTIGFGGPETIVVNRVHVGNPFKFKFYSVEEEEEEEEEEEAGPVQQARIISEATIFNAATRAGASSNLAPDFIAEAFRAPQVSCANKNPILLQTASNSNSWGSARYSNKNEMLLF